MALSNANYNVRLNKLNEKIDLIQSDFENYNTCFMFDTIYVNVSKLFLLNNLKTIYKMLNLNGSNPKKLYKKLHAWLHDQNSSKLLNQSKIN